MNMTREALGAALVSALISLLTTLVTLWSQPGVANFGDIAPVAYAVAIAGALAGALQGYVARNQPTPGTLPQRREDDAKLPHGGESGYARLPFLLALWMASFIGVVSLPGCATPPTPLHTIAATSTAVEQLALQIDLVQKSGQISNEREDKLLDDLARINRHLQSVMYLPTDLRQADLEMINQQLIELRAELAKEQKR